MIFARMRARAPIEKWQVKNYLFALIKLKIAQPVSLSPYRIFNMTQALI